MSKRSTTLMPTEDGPAVDLGGTVRQCAPEETLERIRPVFPKVGITRIARVTGLDCIGIAVSVAIRPLSRSLSVSQGKGLTQALADVSAAMESIEHYHAEHPEAPELVGSFEQLEHQHALVDPTSLPAGPFPRGIDLRTTPTAWYRGIDLFTQEPCHVPHYACNLATDESYGERLAVYCSSNGLASGNTLTEATLHALYEVVERDALAPSRTSHADQGIEIDVHTLDEPASHLIEAFIRAGVSVRLWEHTSEIGLPTFRCSLSGAAELRGLPSFGGYGTHLSRRIAVCRALTEAAQSRLTVISGSRDDNYPSDYVEYRSASRAGVAPEPAHVELRHFEDCADIHVGPTLTENLEQVLGRLRQRGLRRAVAVDMSKPSLGIPVVSVTVPGLRHVAE